MPEQPSTPPPDPSGIEQPHDVLAAEEFGIGARDDRFPPDPSGISQPHDVLAAEEFAMPAGVEAYNIDADSGGRSWLPLAGLLALGAAVLLALRARRR